MQYQTINKKEKQWLISQGFELDPFSDKDIFIFECSPQLLNSLKKFRKNS